MKTLLTLVVPLPTVAIPIDVLETVTISVLSTWYTLSKKDVVAPTTTEVSVAPLVSRVSKCFIYLEEHNLEPGETLRLTESSSL